MNTVGIICEYNPIHTGHTRQIEYAKANGADAVVCIMSGNFTQRGELAIADKYTRAHSAIASGADVVLELPFPYSSMSAEFFAAAGVSILSRIGVDTLCFGHECDDIEILKNTAKVLSSEEFKEALNTKGKSGTAKGFFETLAAVSGIDYSLGSNDILGAYYIAAINKLCPKMKILPIQRKGAAYRENELLPDTFPSATALRCAICRDGTFGDSLSGYIPENAVSVFAEAEKNSIAPVHIGNISNEILSFLRLMSPDEIKNRAVAISGGESILDDGQGIVRRLCSCAVTAENIDEMLRLAYNSKFTDSRIRRVLLFSLLGVSDGVKSYFPEYTTLLAASRIGREFLSSARKSAQIPIITKPADTPRDSIQYRLSLTADALYAQAMPKKEAAGYFAYLSPYIEK